MLLASAIFQGQYSESNQLRTILPNGSVVFVEKRDAPYASIQLILGTRGLIETPANHGYRHLLEHLVARSIPKHDFQLESQGGALYAYTARDWMRFEWRVPPELIPVALGGISKFLKPQVFGKDLIERESKMIGLERSHLSPSDRSSIEIWSAIFGAEGQDAVGTWESTSKAEPEQLTDIWRTITRSNNVVISASGPIDIKTFTDDASSLVRGLASNNAVRSNRKAAGNVSTNQAVGLALQSIEKDATAAMMVAAFGMTSRIPSPFVTFTPTASGGVLLLGSLGTSIPRGTGADESDVAIYHRGKQLALEWLDSKLMTPEGSAEFNGTLLSLSPAIRPRKLRENFENVNYELLKVAVVQLKEALR